MQLIATKLNVGLWAASYIKGSVQAFAPTKNRPFVLGLPTGGTVVDMYAVLRAFVHEHLLNFQNILTFNMDEYVGLPTDHPQSYHSYMHQHLWDAVHMPAEHCFIPDGQATDLHAQCRQYESAIARVGGIDLFVGGIGRNGHIAFNEPGTPFHSRTHVQTLTQSTREANARFFLNDISRVPRQAITVGIGTILDAKELLFIASGTHKAVAIARLVTQEPNLSWPLTALKLHPHAKILVDLDACVLLSGAIKTRLDQAREQNPHAQEWMVEVPA